jgi:hypothetical protein
MDLQVKQEHKDFKASMGPIQADGLLLRMGRQSMQETVLLIMQNSVKM